MGWLALERAGPLHGHIAALCWCGGFMLSAIGVYTHQLWLMLARSGVIGGIDIGLATSALFLTLINHGSPTWRGMATGMAIMGFGGGAMIGAPLPTADELFQDPNRRRRLADVRHDGADLLRVHDDGCVRLSRAAGRLETRWLDTTAAERLGNDFRP